MTALFSNNPEIIYFIATFSVCYLARVSVRLKHVKYGFFVCAAFFIGAVVAFNSPASHDITEMIWRILHATGLGLLYVAGFPCFDI